jgi:hypothetical protein
MIDPCPICEFPKVLTQITAGGSTDVQCPRCGRYTISGTSKALAPQMGPERSKLSGVLRNASDKGEMLSVTTYTINELVARAPRTLSVTQLIDGILLFLADKAMGSGAIRKPVLVDDLEYTPFYLNSFDDFVYVLQMMESQRLIGVDNAVSDKATVRIRIDGWQRIDQLQSTRGRPDRAFVAMWFDESLKPAYVEGIAPALTAAGYDPLRIDLLPHTERIDDRILAEIRRSGLLVADFTGHRQGVYFEAGFALGLAIPVIWSCRKDEIDKAHFDTRQYNHLVWADPTDLAGRLEARIRALGFARK